MKSRKSRIRLAGGQHIKNSQATPAPARRGAGRRRQRIGVSWERAEQFTVPIPRDEEERLAALRRYDILDTPPEKAFDDITLIAAHVCRAPVALIVLIDSARQWFKSRMGVKIQETPRELAFCAHTIMGRRLMVVPDARRDKRFRANPFVTGASHFRFYAGAPLVTPDNRTLGTICVIDTKPRHLSADQSRDLMALSRVVVRELELRRSLLQERRQG